MSGKNKSRKRLLSIMQYLADNVENGERIDIEKIISYLNDDEFSHEPIIREDLKVLAEMKKGVIYESRGSSRNKHFYYDRLITDGELMLIFNIICSACYLTKDKAIELIQHLCNAMSVSKFNELDMETDIVLRNKTFNDKCIENIEVISEAISKGKKISFSYAGYDEEGRYWYLLNVRGNKYEKVMVETKEHISSEYIEDHIYTVSPCKIVWDNSQCYLICIISDGNSRTIKNFRADKIYEISMEAEDSDRFDTSSDFYDPDRGIFDAEKYLRSIFEMFISKNARLTEVTFVVKKRLIGAMYDKFGPNIKPAEYDDTHFTFKAQIQEAPTFYSWAAKYTPQELRILAPDEIVVNYREHLKRILEAY